MTPRAVFLRPAPVNLGRALARITSVGAIAGCVVLGFLILHRSSLDRELAAQRLVCPFYSDGQGLIDETVRSDGSVVCRYNVSRGFMRERLMQPNPRRGMT